MDLAFFEGFIFSAPIFKDLNELRIQILKKLHTNF